MKTRILSKSPAAAVAVCAITSILMSVPAAAETNTAPPAARIAFANHGGIRNWRADGTRTLYVQDIHGRWYRAELLAPCFDLPFAEHVGFVSEPGGEFNRFSSIIVRGQQCMVKTFSESGAPPTKARAHAGAKADANGDASKEPAREAGKTAQP